MNSRMNISVPNNVRKRMDEHGSANWSAIATIAFVRYMDGESAEQQCLRLEKEITDLRRRLAQIRDVIE